MVYNVNFGAILIIYNMTIMNSETVFILYMKAGPTYIRTLLTSSLIRFIKSPVLLFL